MNSTHDTSNTDTSNTDTPTLVLDLIDILEQGRDLIAASSDELYSASPEQFKASSLGAHYRHHLEHVCLLLSGHQQGSIDYDARTRDPRLESERAFAISCTHTVIEKLQRIPHDALLKDVVVVCRSCTTSKSRPETRSTLGRELLFLISHAVHHYALMRILVEVQGSNTCNSFGVMPSTLADETARRKVFER